VEVSGLDSLIEPSPHRFIRILPCAVVLLISAWSAGAEETIETSGDYFPAIRQELARLNIKGQCNDASSSCVCSKTIKGSKSADVLEMVIHHSVRTATIYIYIDHFLTLPAETTLPADLAKRMLILNAEMVTAKFEWDEATGGVRLSTVLNIDSNFDRKAFRSQVLGLWEVAAEVRPQLQALMPQ
jgi:hypothetical protein